MHIIMTLLSMVIILDPNTILYIMNNQNLFHPNNKDLPNCKHKYMFQHKIEVHNCNIVFKVSFILQKPHPILIEHENYPQKPIHHP